MQSPSAGKSAMTMRSTDLFFVLRSIASANKGSVHVQPFHLPSCQSTRAGVLLWIVPATAADLAVTACASVGTEIRSGISGKKALTAARISSVLHSSVKRDKTASSQRDHQTKASGIPTSGTDGNSCWWLASRIKQLSMSNACELSWIAFRPR